MGYTPQTINPGDVASASWANKVENFLAQFGNYQGVLSSKDNLPASADVGDWYLVLDAIAIFVWDGSFWRKIGGGDVMIHEHEDLNDYVIEPVIETFTGDGTTTSFTLAYLKDTDVFLVEIDGVATTAYTVSGNTITFTTAPANGSVIDVYGNPDMNVKYADVTVSPADDFPKLTVGVVAYGQGEISIWLDNTVAGTFTLSNDEKGFGYEWNKSSISPGAHRVEIHARVAPDKNAKLTIGYFGIRW